MTTTITETDTVFALDIDEQPAPEPAAPVYDLDAPDAEWHDKPVVTVAMALDVLRSGRALMTQCGPLQVTLSRTERGEISCDVWNTETCVSTSVLMSEALSVQYLNTFGRVADGDWRTYCPAEPDGAPLY